MESIVIVSNRIPGKTAAAGGLAVALKKVLSERDGFWFGWSGEFSEKYNSDISFEDVDGLKIGSIDLNHHDYHGYYEGFSNSVIWPAFHHRVDLINIDPLHYEAYLRVNREFALALENEVTPDQTIWIHDYHLIPLGRELRRLGLTNKIGFFLHIPVPGTEIFSAIPNSEDLLDCLAAYDIVGLQAERDVERLNQQYDSRRVIGVNENTKTRNRPANIKAFPIGTDPDAFRALAQKPNAARTARLVEKSTAGRKLILGVDRLDYSKGLPERVAGYERLLELFPDWRREVQMLQIAPPSRGNIAEYQNISDQLDIACGRVMGKFAELDWAPLNYVKKTYPQTALAGLYSISRVALVTPLRDGMNLVAHEFVSCQDPQDPGVLILSRFAGAAEIMDEALIVNPHDADEMAHALDLALRMPLKERIERWHSLIRKVETFTVDAWASSFLEMLAHSDAEVESAT